MTMNSNQMPTPLECKNCGGSFSSGKCQSCGSPVAVAKSQFETDQHLRSRLDGGAYFVHFGKLEGNGSPESHQDEQE